MKDVENTLNSYTYPVFVNAGNERPDLIASSVVITIGLRTFLITASHVLDQVSYVNSPFYIGLEGGFVSIVGEFTRSENNNKKDFFDIAFIELANEFVVSNNIKALSEDKLMVTKHFESVHLSLIHGYPCSKNKQGKALKGGTSFKSYAFTYGGKIDTNFDFWEKYNKSKIFHTCMNYGRSKDINGEINTPPSPRGISGGGLWLVPDSSLPENVYLDAIFIEYYSTDKISFSTKIAKVVEFIGNNT